MEAFWYTTGTIPNHIPGFSAFGTTHLIWLGVAVLACIVCCLHYRHLGEKGRRIWRIAVAVLLVADEIFKDVCLHISGSWTPEYLPLHLCSINIFLILWHSLKPNALLGNFLYTACIPGAIAALLFPTWTALPFGNFMHMHSFTVHILLALYPLVLSVCGDIRPDVRQVPKVVGVLIVLAVVMYFINPLLDSNFFFMASADEGNPLYWFEVNWGSHLLGFPVLVSAVLLVMHGPVLLWRRLRKK